MSTYKEINGTAIEALSADPPNPQDGQVWYRTDLGTFKTQKESVLGGWSTGGDLNSARFQLAGAGTQTAALGFGGTPSPTSATTESYNGTSWTELNDLNTGRRALAGTGTQTTALGFGGTPYTVLTESWNGTNWTEVNDLNQGREHLIGAGADNTSALGFGGYIFPNPAGPPGRLALTESWNGTNWTEVNDMNITKFRHTGGGTQTSALAVGGESPSAVANTESWNGTNWTEVNDLNTARLYIQGAAADNTNALASGGGAEAPFFALTESWNGTSWTEVTDLNIARRQFAGAGTNTVGLAFGGQGAGDVALANTEEWNVPASITETITLE